MPSAETTYRLTVQVPPPGADPSSDRRLRMRDTLRPNRRSLIVASAHNMPVRSYPWRFASVVSVASHDIADPLAYLRNPDPPVEFYARGVDVDVAWADGSTLRASGNSFATPHIAGICALIRSKHPDLTPPEVKTLLGLTATNAEDAG